MSNRKKPRKNKNENSFISMEEKIKEFQLLIDSNSANEMAVEKLDEIPGPIIFKKQIVFDGKGSTIWASKGPVLTIDADNVVIKNLNIEVSCNNDKDEEKIALVVNKKDGVKLENVMCRGLVKGLKSEEGNWEYPFSLSIGRIASNLEQKFFLDIYVPVSCKILSKVSGVKLNPESLSPGTNRIMVLVEPFLDGTILNGDLILVSNLLQRRISINAHIVNQNITTKNEDIIWFYKKDSSLSEQAEDVIDLNEEKPIILDKSQGVLWKLGIHLNGNLLAAEESWNCICNDMNGTNFINKLSNFSVDYLFFDFKQSLDYEKFENFLITVNEEAKENIVKIEKKLLKFNLFSILMDYKGLSYKNHFFEYMKELEKYDKDMKDWLISVGENIWKIFWSWIIVDSTRISRFVKTIENILENIDILFLDSTEYIDNIQFKDLDRIIHRFEFEEICHQSFLKLSNILLGEKEILMINEKDKNWFIKLELEEGTYDYYYNIDNKNIYDKNNKNNKNSSNGDKISFIELKKRMSYVYQKSINMNSLKENTFGDELKIFTKNSNESSLLLDNASRESKYKQYNFSIPKSEVFKSDSKDFKGNSIEVNSTEVKKINVVGNLFSKDVRSNSDEKVIKSESNEALQSKKEDKIAISNNNSIFFTNTDRIEKSKKNSNDEKKDAKPVIGSLFLNKK